jgi:hypothetical protein
MAGVPRRRHDEDDNTPPGASPAYVMGLLTHYTSRADEPGRCAGSALRNDGSAGCGWAQRWGGPVEEIRPGDVIWFAPGEKHWSK